MSVIKKLMATLSQRSQITLNVSHICLKSILNLLSSFVLKINFEEIDGSLNFQTKYIKVTRRINAPMKKYTEDVVFSCFSDEKNAFVIILKPAARTPQRPLPDDIYPADSSENCV